MSGRSVPGTGTGYAAVREARLRELHAALDDAAFAAAWAEGQALSFDAAFALALAAVDETAGARTPTS
ncbi:MAG: hypothetical protein AB7R89_11720 [Dehalococcoidia bacterium]